jgi:hypothetical protein
MAKAKTDSTPIDDLGDLPKTPSKTEPSPWLLIVEDVFPRWRDRLGPSEDAKDKLYDLLFDRGTRAAIQYTSASGEITRDIQHAEFWRDRLELDTDADGVDHLWVNYRPYVHEDRTLSGWNRDFVVRRSDVERWEDLHPWLVAPPSAVVEQDVSAHKLRPPTTPASPPAPATKGRGSRQQRMVQQIVAEEFPDGCDQIETGVIIHQVADRLKRQRLAVPKRDTFLRALGRRKD